MDEPTPVTSRPMPSGQPATAPAPAALSVARCLGMLIVGLLPAAGLIACLAWAYGRHSLPAARSLAKAMLWLHAIALVALIALLCVWVLGLVRQHQLFSGLML